MLSSDCKKKNFKKKHDPRSSQMIVLNCMSDLVFERQPSLLRLGSVSAESESSLKQKQKESQIPDIYHTGSVRSHDSKQPISRQAQITFTFINLADDFMQNNLHSTTQAFAHSNKTCSSSLRTFNPTFT